MPNPELLRKLIEEADSGAHPMNPACSYMFGQLIATVEGQEGAYRQVNADIRGLHEKIGTTTTVTNNKIDSVKKILEEKIDTNHEANSKKLNEIKERALATLVSTLFFTLTVIASLAFIILNMPKG